MGHNDAACAIFDRVKQLIQAVAEQPQDTGPITQTQLHEAIYTNPFTRAL